MFKLLLCLSAYVISVYGLGEITFLYTPKSIVVQGHDRLLESQLEEVYSASLGLTIENDISWQGMYIKSPFDLAEAIVTVAVDGVPVLNLQKGHSFTLKTDAGESNIFESTKARLDEHDNDGNKIERIDLQFGREDLSKSPLFKDIKDVQPVDVGNLKQDVTTELFLSEMAILNAIAEEIESVVASDYQPDLYWFKISGLHTISDVHGINSTTMNQAKEILNAVLNKLTEAYIKAYQNKVLVNVIASDASHTRRVRETDAGTNADTDKIKPKNLAGRYTKEYPAIFNIILWFGVTIFFALLAICIFIATMDPGRDSIIYRMTSTRMKKDN